MTDVANEDGKTKPTTWFLYLIECRDGSIYTGIAKNVSARYAAHANGTSARYTRMHPPARLLASREYPDRSSALKAECAVKKLSAQAKRRYADEISGTPGENRA